MAAEPAPAVGRPAASSVSSPGGCWEAAAPPPPGAAPSPGGLSASDASELDTLDANELELSVWEVLGDGGSGAAASEVPTAPAPGAEVALGPAAASPPRCCPPGGDHGAAASSPAAAALSATEFASLWETIMSFEDDGGPDGLLGGASGLPDLLPPPALCAAGQLDGSPAQSAAPSVEGVVGQQQQQQQQQPGSPLASASGAWGGYLDLHRRALSPTSSSGTSPERCCADSSEGTTAALAGAKGKRPLDTADEELKKTDLQEWRRQRRLAKNRKTAAVSRERKKTQLASLNSELESVRRENESLKELLACQQMQIQYLKGEVASLTRGATVGTNTDTDAASEPAVLDDTIATLPLVPHKQWSVSPYSRQALVLSAVCLLACTSMAYNTANQALETLVASLAASTSHAPLPLPASEGGAAVAPAALLPAATLRECHSDTVPLSIRPIEPCIVEVG